MRSDDVHGYSAREEARRHLHRDGRGRGRPALAAGLVDEATWQRGIAGLRRTAGPDGVFCYTFFKGVGIR
jgi:hypothetical protein